MSVVVMLFLVLLASLFQSAAPAWLVLGEAKPPLLAGIVLYYALTRDRGATLLAAVLAGTAEDALSMTPLGYSAALYCVIGFVINGSRGLFYAESPVTAGLFGAGCGVVSGLMLGFLLRRADLVAAGAFPDLRKLAGTAVLGLVCTPVVFGVAFGFDRMLGNLRPRREAADAGY